MTDKQRENLEDTLRADFFEIDRKFASLTFSVRKSLMARNISPAVLADLLSDLQQGTPLTEGSESTCGLKDQNTNIKDASDIKAVFDILKPYYSFFNYDIIALIVSNLGCASDRTNLEQYEKAFEVYCMPSHCL